MEIIKDRNKKYFEIILNYDGAFYIHPKRHLIEIKTTQETLNKIDEIMEDLKDDILYKNVYDNNDYLYIKIYLKRPIKTAIVYLLQNHLYLYSSMAYFRTYTTKRNLQEIYYKEITENE